MKRIISLFLVTLSVWQIQGQIPILLDTDANNELDDQHAIAYMLFNSDIFNVVGITVNATTSGGQIDQHVAEAKRVVKLCGYGDEIKVVAGASKDFAEILPDLDKAHYDGKPQLTLLLELPMKMKTENWW